MGRYSQLDRTLKGILTDARLSIRRIRAGAKLNETEMAQAAEAMESAIDVFSKSEPVQMAGMINFVNLGITAASLWVSANPPELTGRTSGGPPGLGFDLCWSWRGFDFAEFKNHGGSHTGASAGYSVGRRPFPGPCWIWPDSVATTGSELGC